MTNDIRGGFSTRIFFFSTNNNNDDERRRKRIYLDLVWFNADYNIYNMSIVLS